jgi:hypothetical protein
MLYLLDSIHPEDSSLVLLARNDIIDGACLNITMIDAIVPRGRESL